MLSDDLDFFNWKCLKNFNPATFMHNLCKKPNWMKSSNLYVKQRLGKQLSEMRYLMLLIKNFYLLNWMQNSFVDKIHFGGHSRNKSWMILSTFLDITYGEIRTTNDVNCSEMHFKIEVRFLIPITVFLLYWYKKCFLPLRISKRAACLGNFAKYLSGKTQIILP